MGTHSRPWCGINNTGGGFERREGNVRDLMIAAWCLWTPVDVVGTTRTFDRATSSSHQVAARSKEHVVASSSPRACTHISFSKAAKAGHQAEAVCVPFAVRFIFGTTAAAVAKLAFRPVDSSCTLHASEGRGEGRPGCCCCSRISCSNSPRASECGLCKGSLRLFIDAASECFFIEPSLCRKRPSFLASSVGSPEEEEDVAKCTYPSAIAEKALGDYVHRRGGREKDRGIAPVIGRAPFTCLRTLENRGLTSCVARLFSIQSGCRRKEGRPQHQLRNYAAGFPGKKQASFILHPLFPPSPPL